MSDYVQGCRFILPVKLETEPQSQRPKLFISFRYRQYKEIEPIV